MITGLVYKTLELPRHCLFSYFRETYLRNISSFLQISNEKERWSFSAKLKLVSIVAQKIFATQLDTSHPDYNANPASHSVKGFCWKCANFVAIRGKVPQPLGTGPLNFTRFAKLVRAYLHYQYSKCSLEACTFIKSILGSFIYIYNPLCAKHTSPNPTPSSLKAP